MSAEVSAIGVDLGATKIASALVSPSGAVLASRQTLTCPADGPEAVLDRLAAEVEALANQAPGHLAGVGIGSPGWVDPTAGVIRNAVNLGWLEVPLVAGVTNRLRCAWPVWVQKDTNASTLGEYYFGAGQGCQDFVYLSVGSGLGGGVIANGQLVSGALGIAADLGHLSLDPHGRLCACGLRGCSETIVSGPGLVSVTAGLLEQAHPASLLEGTPTLTPTIILDAARKGDPVAEAAFAEIGAALGFILSACVAVLNPARFIIGGGLGLAAFDLLLPSTRQELARRVPRSGSDTVQIVASRLASSAIGAACLVWQRN
jgi:glucokinase